MTNSKGGPYTCCQCNAATWNDCDWCDACTEAARIENERLASPARRINQLEHPARVKALVRL